MLDDISNFLLYVAPGFIAIEIYHWFYPSKQRDSYVRLSQSIVVAVVILYFVRFVDSTFLSSSLHSDTPGIPDFKFAGSLIFSGVIAGYIGAYQLRFRSFLSKRFDRLSWLSSHPDDIWLYVNSPNVEDWAVVYLDDDSIYRGWIKRYRFDPNEENQDFILSKATRVDDDLNVLYDVNGIGVYLNTRNVRNPDHTDHRFRCIPTTDSGAFRPLIPIHSDHLRLVFSRTR